jgi:hypothetical protein
MNACTSVAVELEIFNVMFQTDDIGDVYQDEENMAALLVQRDAKNGGILVVSTVLKNSFNTFTLSKTRKTIHLFPTDF